MIKKKQSENGAHTHAHTHEARTLKMKLWAILKYACLEFYS